MDDILRIFAGGGINQADHLDVIAANNQLALNRPEAVQRRHPDRADFFQPAAGAIISYAGDRIRYQLNAALAQAEAAANAVQPRRERDYNERPDPFITPAAAQPRAAPKWTHRQRRRRHNHGIAAFAHEFFPTASKWSWKRWRPVTTRRSTFRRKYTKGRSSYGRYVR